MGIPCSRMPRCQSRAAITISHETGRMRLYYAGNLSVRVSYVTILLTAPAVSALRIALLAASLLCCFNACKRRHTVVLPAFYFWKSDHLSLYEEDYSLLTHLKTRRLYVKLFEVTRKQPLGLVPASKTSLCSYPNFPDSTGYYAPEVIPTVFINNSALTGITANESDFLADNILFLARKYYSRLEVEHWPWRELQIDCDWSASNKESYFRLLRALKQKSGLLISCTLRLYPYKYRDKMGVPPVDRAMLMCYNLLNPLSSGDENSILSTAQLKGYLGRRSIYPLPLDIALPVYDRMQWYRQDQFSGVIHAGEADLSRILMPLKPYWYELQRDTVIDGDYLRAGDKIKYESITPDVLREAAAMLRDAVPLGDTATIAFFHLDPKILQYFNYATLDSVSASFGR